MSLSAVLPRVGGTLYGQRAGIGRPLMAVSLTWFLILTYRKYFRARATPSRSSKMIGILLLITYFPIVYAISLVIEATVSPGEISSSLVRGLLLFPLSMLWK